MPASETSATLFAALDPLRELAAPAPPRCPRGRRRAAAPADAELLEQAAGAAGVLAGDRRRRSTQRLARARGDVVEVADRRRADDQLARHQPSCARELDPAPSPRRRSCRRRGRARPRRPGSCSSAAARALAAPRRAGSSSRSPAGDHAAADHDHVGLEDVGEAGQSDAEAAADQRRRRSTRGLVAGERRLGRPPCRRSSSPRGERLAERRVGLALRRGPRPRGRARCPRRAPRRSRGWGSCPGRAARRSSITMWPSSAPAPVEPR